MSRTHEEIVRGFGASKMAHALRDRGVLISIGAPQRWAERNSIPGEYWAHLAELGVASLEELAESAKATPQADPRAA